MPVNDQALSEATAALAEAKEAIGKAAEALGVELPDSNAQSLNDAIRAKAGA